MEFPKAQPAPAVTTAMVCAGAVGAQFVAGKAARDTLFLANLDVTALPAMVVATAAFSILLVALSSRGVRRVAPGTLIPIAFAISAALFLADWVLLGLFPKLAAQALYLQVSGLGPMLGSGFWLIVTEHFDPHTAKRTFGRIGAAGTLSGLIGALVADRIAATFGMTMMLPLLAALNLVCAWQTRVLANATATSARKQQPDAADADTDADAMQAGSMLDATAHLAVSSPRSGLRALAETPYLRNLAAFVLLSTMGATLVDYLFKAEAVEAFGREEMLLRFFAIYYAATALLSLIVQVFAGAPALARLGIGLTTSTPPLALCAGGIGALVVPGLWSVVAMRGGESVFRGSLFRTGYEVFYTPVPPEEKRAAKSLIDVGFDRLGDALGAALISLALLLPVATQYNTMLVWAILSAAVALVIAQRLNRGYIHTLERSLVNRAVELDLSDIDDLTTRTAILKTRTLSMATPILSHESSTETVAVANDTELQAIVTLRSRNPSQVVRILRDEQGLPGALVPHVIPLLAWDSVAEDAVRALRKVAEERLGALTDALLDPNQPFAVRRRLARVFSICVSQRAVDALLLALDDARFEVRFQCGRSLSAILAKNSLVRIDRERIFEVVRREVTVSRPVWQSHRLLDAMGDERASFVDDFIKDRAGQSLAHVFVLLSLVLPATPLQIAYRGLHTTDPGLRGTALEYLEGVLPPDIRERLWPFLGTSAPVNVGARGRDEILADLLRSNDSIVMNLQELRRRSGTKS
jgi:ATP:ADP antiporter, AAA family